MQTLRLLNAALHRQTEDPSALDMLDRERAALDSTAGLLFLKAIGYRTIAADSIEHLDRALSDADREPDLIISDYHLGDSTTGIDVIHTVRSRTGRPLPALLLRGDTSAVLRKLADVPACRLLSKPVDVLAATIADLLRADGRA